MRRLDVIELGRQILEDLRDQTGTTAAMAIWANRGPTIVRAAEPAGSLASHIRIGSVLPLLSSSIGQCFAAFLDRRITQELMQEELSDPALAARTGLKGLDDVEVLLADCRARRMSSATTLVHAGRMALTAPVFNHDGDMVAAICVIGLTDHIDFSWEGKPAQMLAAAAQRMSRTLNVPERTKA